MLKRKEMKNVDCNVYLGYKITLGRENQTIEINRRKRLVWASARKLSTLKNKNILLRI